jgi:hypothetical protein
MLDSLTATRFHRRMTSGRSAPFLLECEDAADNAIELVAKFTGPQLTVTSLVREALCAMLAADLGLPIPACYCVSLSADFLAALAGTHKSEADYLSAAVPIGFGSAKLPPGYAAWMPERSIPKVMQAEAAEIYAFDLLLQNPDRKPTNPNLLSKGERFAIFDHELALITEGVLFWKPPWEPGALTAQRAPEGHILRAGLRGTKPDFARLIGAWEAIDDTRLATYEAALPPEWTPVSSRDTVNAGLGFLRALRQNLRPALQEVVVTLS